MTQDCSAFIPALDPYGLGLVPGYRTQIVVDPDGGQREIEDDAWRKDWFAWRDRVHDLRLDIHYAMECAESALRKKELQLCATDAAYWLAIYGWIDEPRAIDGEDYFKPFVPFAYQVDLLQWFIRLCESPVVSDGYVSKSRGCGATRIMCAAATWGLLFRTWRGILISRKEDIVDKPLDLNSMFGFIDLLMDMIPKWMEPPGYDRQFHRLKMMIQNPATKSQITGESTTKKATRAGRATYVLYDEASFIPDFQAVFATGAGTTKHRVPVSSESPEEGFYFYEAWNAVKKINPEAVKEIDYYHNVYFDADWHAQELARWEQANDPEGFQREYYRDPFAGYGSAVYPLASRLDESAESYVPGLPLLVGVDPGLADDTAIVFAQWEGEGVSRKLRFVDSYENNRLPAEWYAHILTGIPTIPGDPCHGLPFTSRDRKIMDWLYGVPYNYLQVACDPSGGQRDSSGLSFVERIYIESLRLRERDYQKRLNEQVELTTRGGKISESAALEDAYLNVQRPKAIVPFYKDLFAKNRYDDRQKALRKYLTHVVFAPTLGARRIREALMKYRFADPTTNATSQPKPVHDQWSHLVTACEYLAVWIDINVIGGIPGPVRTDDPALLRDAQRAKIASDYAQRVA